MKASLFSVVATAVFLAVACGGGDDEPVGQSSAGSGGDAGSAGSGGSAAGGTAGASGRGGSSGRGGAGGSGGAAGSNGAAGSSGTAGSGGSAGLDAGGPDADASTSDAGDAGSDASRECFQPSMAIDAGACTLAVCRRGAKVEVSVTNQSGWTVGALYWLLTICDESFFETRAPTGSGTTLIYDIDAADWANARVGDPIYMSYGEPSDYGRLSSCGRVPQNVPACAP